MLPWLPSPSFLKVVPPCPARGPWHHPPPPGPWDQLDGPRPESLRHASQQSHRLRPRPIHRAPNLGAAHAQSASNMPQVAARRRKHISAAGLACLAQLLHGAAAAPLSGPAAGVTWRDWDRRQVCHPGQLLQPASVEEVQATARQALVGGPSFAYSLPVHPVHTRRDRVASLTTCRLHGAAIRSASPLGPGRALTLPCGWNNLRRPAAEGRRRGALLLAHHAHRRATGHSPHASHAPQLTADHRRNTRHSRTQSTRRSDQQILAMMRNAFEISPVQAWRRELHSARVAVQPAVRTLSVASVRLLTTEDFKILVGRAVLSGPCCSHRPCP